MKTLRLVSSPFENLVRDLLRNAEREILVASPFINLNGAKIFRDATPNRNRIELALLTNLSAQNIVAGVTQPDAVLELCEGFKNASVSSLHRLHAKVFVIDERISLIGSANLTGGGLRENYEYGAMIDDEELALKVRADILRYANLGNQISQELLREIAQDGKRLAALKAAQEKETQKREAAKALRIAERKLNEKLLANRAKSGKTINEIFAETILHLLAERGRLTTRELHRLVQETHPDICDDKIDRVINGLRFGKLWKHQVRNAQRFLKAQGKIQNVGEGRKTVWTLKA